MSARKLGIALLLGLVALIFLLLRTQRGPASAPAASTAAADVPAPERELASSAVAEERSSVQAEAAAPEPEPAPRPAPTEPEAAESSERIEGVLRVFDELDRCHEDLDGSFLLSAEDERVDEWRTIEVNDGHFAADLRTGVEYTADDVRADGRRAVPLSFHQPRRNERGAWEVAARFARETVLTVVAADTGLELAGIDLVELSNGSESCIPGALDQAQWLARDARSPITLPLPAEVDEEGEPLFLESGARILHARAPGYAWGCLNAPESLGGEFRLALVPGGSLEIRVVGLDASVAEAVLRLRRAGSEDEAPVYEAPLEERTTVVLDGLEAGAWVATLELGHRYRWPRVLARGEIEVPAGAHAVLELRIEPVEEPRLVAMSGRVIASRAWGFTDLDVTAELLDEPPRGSAQRWLRATVDAPRDAHEDPAVWEWTLEGAQPGKWSVELPKLGVGLPVDLTLQASTDVELVVPDPVELSVELRERGTDLPVPDGHPAWIPARPWTDVGGALKEAEMVGLGRFTARVPAGPIELWCFSDRHRFVREELALAPPRVERVVRLDPACGFLLRVRHGTTLLPWPLAFGYPCEATRVDGEGEAWLTDQDENELEARFTASAPGRYRLALPLIPGYAPIPPQEIVVPSEGFVRYDVELRVP